MSTNAASVATQLSPARPDDGSKRRAYRGRFAPSPSGPLHFGSLVAALGSYLDARAHDGEWLLRIEDVDQQRTQRGAVDDILRTLDGFGFAWDGELVLQSRRLDFYHAALVRLQLDGDVYPCACSRREIAELSPRRSVDGGQVYPGTCRGGLAGGRAARAWRLRLPDQCLAFDDRVQGRHAQNLECAVGDIILLRADGQYAYQLAVVADDAAQGVTAVVRGVDLLDSTARQIWLQQRLRLPTPTYAHLPVVINAAGEKLSKQTRAAAVDPAAGSALLAAALNFLGHPVPQEISAGSLTDFWSWAIAAWSIERVPARRGVFPGEAIAGK
ncbi:tRNA glutamyl-Q(34) synthetase GluQRS [Candidatus Accumulibacter sp. ACC003]|uniref:tRNA glutamyl-Q(34) synthetase GluQRS n=1 Tax=Candidatus Accumulibacter sp. ACC003 TaxID=2823334 RepID=UPI0025B9E3A9|nr:tRNA glutamyl-Q(34) synthetase GluQRS [Candidatus Accumulibacter sp. ACC003]